MSYSGGRGTVCELELGRIHIGGEISWLSQYPLEEELTLPPFTCLERNGEPRVERTPESEIVIFPLKVRQRMRDRLVRCGLRVLLISQVFV